jgi:ribosomal protein S18 acetylase RimI-like enzyme
MGQGSGMTDFSIAGAEAARWDGFSGLCTGIIQPKEQERSMLVRLAANEDVAAVMRLVRRIVPLMRASGNLQWDDAYPNAEVFGRDVEAKQLWIAEVDGQIAGFAAITTDQQAEYALAGLDVTEEAIVVHRLAVDPAYRGKGIAAALMVQAETVARERGIEILRIDTNVDNQATQALFPKLGYRLAGEVGFEFRPGLRFLCYEKRL